MERATSAATDSRGLTLIELLLVIGLLLSLGALVLPAVDRRLDRQAFESTADLVLTQLRLARAHARRTGEPVAVTYRDTPPRIEASRYETGVAVEDGAGSSSKDVGEDRRIHEAWALRPLPTGCWMSDEQDTPGQSTRPEALRLAVFLPDGSALAGDPAWIGGNGQTPVRVAVSPWTGLASVSTAEAVQRKLEASEDEPDDELDEPPIEDFGEPLAGDGDAP